MRQIVHVLSEQFRSRFVAQHPQAGGVTERRIAERIDAVDCFRCPLKKEPEEFAALSQSFLGLLSLGNFGGKSGIGDRKSFGSLSDPRFQQFMLFERPARPCD